MAQRGNGAAHGTGCETHPSVRSSRSGWARWSARLRRHPAPVLLALMALALVGAALLAGPPARAAAPRVDRVSFATDVDPAAAHFIGGAIDRAQTDGATALVIEIDTFGGDLASMQTIREKELGSAIPVIVYVAPSGAHADSAGALLALAAPLVAMAPGTRIGSASPVSSSGQDLSDTERAKVTNALTAQVRADQKLYGRNVDAAVAMVTTASAYDAGEAVAQNIVNLQADNLDQLLAQVDGTSIRLANGSTVTLATRGLPVQSLDPTAVDQFFGVLLDPTVLFILFIVAAICIYLELAHPGAIVPGTVGAIALLLFLFGAGSINPNWAGLALMVLAIVLLAVDVRAPTHGVLTTGALICLVIGSLIFFNSGPADQSVNPWLIYGTAAGVGLIALIVIRYAIRLARSKVDTGGDRLVGQTAQVISALAPTGRVRILGEDWSATLLASPGAPAGSVPQADVGVAVRIVAVRGLTLEVRLVAPANAPARTSIG
jgi:membrane-bound serine protease (ClpP class)